MKKSVPIKKNSPELVEVVKYTALAVIVVTAVCAIFAADNVGVAIPIDITLIIMGLIFGYWTRKH